MMDTTAVKLFYLVVLVGCWQTSGQGQVVLFKYRLASTYQFVGNVYRIYMSSILRNYVHIV